MDIPTLLQNGPKTAKELSKMMGVSEKTLYKHVNRLVDEQKILVYPLRTENRWSSLYSLPEHLDVASSLSGYLPIVKLPSVQPRIREAVDRLRVRLMRNPDVDEIIIEIGENPEDKVVRDLVYRIGYAMKWKPPLAKERENADKELERILKVATWLKKGFLDEKDSKGASRADIEKAKAYLQRFPEAIP